ncbi:MAG: hypothetical protein HC927_10905 [Deltaproteobacteria bacterium]|nr:hypothetical protein [Deltaproteobacteria bacterium]
MSTLLYLLIAALAAIGLIQTVRTQARGRRYLESSPEEQPLQISHLSSRLQALVRDTRALRLSLEGPLRELREGTGPALLNDYDELQRHLDAAARELGEWLQEVDRLPLPDAEYVHDVGAEPERIRSVFETEGWAFERRRQPGQRPLQDRLQALVDELRSFEERLQTPPNPYR